MTISERIFELLTKTGMSQKEFSDKTGIAPSTISDWKKKGTNPTADKIMTICKVLNVTPYLLLSGEEPKGSEKADYDYVIVDKKSDEALILKKYNELKPSSQNRLLGYLDALSK